MLHIFQHWTGYDGQGIYDVISGFIPLFAYLGGLVAIWHIIRRHNCGEPRCWHVGFRKVPGTEHYACHKHHPEPRPTKGHMRREYLRVKNELEGRLPKV